MRNKFIGTYHCFSGLQLKVIRKMLSCEMETHGQFRIVCKARGIDHANEITKDIGYKVFRREYSAETGNEKELKAFEDNPQVNFIISYLYRDKFITDIELNKILELIKEYSNTETAKKIFAKIDEELCECTIVNEGGYGYNYQGYEASDFRKRLTKIAKQYGVFLVW